MDNEARSNRFLVEEKPFKLMRMYSFPAADILTAVMAAVIIDGTYRQLNTPDLAWQLEAQ